MRALPVSAVNWIAGLVVLGGAAWAGTVAFGPRDSGPDVANLQALADRLAGQRGPTLGDRDAGGRRATSDEPELIAMPRVDYAALRRARQRLAAANATPAEAPAHDEPSPAPATPAPAPEPAEPAEDELKNLALVGVTSTDGKDAALLVHLESQERESVSVGGSILGFKVKAIQPDAVVLTRGAQDHTLRLGDHDVAQASAGAGDDDDDGSPFGRRDRGEDRSRFAGGFGGFGDRTFQAGDFRQRGGDGDRRQWMPTDTGGFGGRDNQDRRDGQSDRGGRSTTSGFSTPVFGGGFGGFGGGFGGFGSRNRQSTGSTSTFAAGGSGSSTNPQTARRRGTQATGDIASQPEPIANPQTQRRRGTSNEPAFGESDNTARQSGTGRGR